MLNVTIDDAKLIQQLDDMPAKIRAALLKTTYALALKLKRHIIVNKLQGQVLKHQSGALQRSIQDEVIDGPQGVYGRVYSAGDVKYAAIHEYGGKTPPHVIEAKRGEALAFIMGGKQVFFKKVNHPGSQMPERSFMRSSLRDMKPEIVEAMRKAVAEGTKL